MSIFPGKFLAVGVITLDDGTIFERSCVCDKKSNACDAAASLAMLGFVTSVIAADRMDFCPHCKKLVVGKWMSLGGETFLVCPRCMTEVEWDVYDGA